MTKRYCELRGGDTTQSNNIGEPLHRCPSYCLGEEMVIVDRPLVLDKLGPIVPKIGLICAEVPEPQVQQLDSLMCLFSALRDVINNHNKSNP